MQRRRVLISALGGLVGVVSSRLGARPVAADSVGEDFAFVDVPTYAQQRNLSCEYASLVIAMGAYGTWVSEWTFDDSSPCRTIPTGDTAATSPVRGATPLTTGSIPNRSLDRWRSSAFMARSSMPRGMPARSRPTSTTGCPWSCGSACGGIRASMNTPVMVRPIR